MRFKSHRMRTLESTWGLRLDLLNRRLYLGVHLGHLFRSWWIEWGDKAKALKCS